MTEPSKEGFNRKTRSPIERIKEKLRPAKNGCIEWTGSKGGGGYGRIRVGSVRNGSHRMISVHRFIYEQHHGPIPRGMIIMHKCDNPACANIEHLSLGTNAMNSRDMTQKDRQNRGEKQHLSKLTESDVVKIREDYDGGLFTQKELASEYGVNRQTISNVVNFVTWKHVG